MPEPVPSPGGPTRTLGCIGLLFALGMIVLGAALILQGRPPDTGQQLPAPTVAPELPLPPTIDARAPNGKLTPPDEIVAAPVVPSDIDRRPVPAAAADDLRRLMRAVLPVHDYVATAERLGGFSPEPRPQTAAPLVVGDRQSFNTAGGPRQADLIHLTPTGAYWVEVGLALDPAAVATAAEIVESRYLAAMQATFGREWSPGVDLDPRIHVLHVLGSPDAFELGYFSDENQYPQALFVESNEREMVYLNMSRLEVGSDLYLGTLLHELQHLSQWHMDPNEQVWLNEGLSQLAETMAGLETVDPAAYLAQPAIRLDRWSTAADEVYAHYGGSYLYLLYLWQRAGEDAVRELARHPANGMAAITAVLEGFLPHVSLAEFSADWAVATYLDSTGMSGLWGYERADLPPLGLATRARQLPFATVGRLEQTAVEVIDLDLSGPVRLRFVGDTVSPLVDGPPPDGDRLWFAAADNSSAASLTAVLDLTAHSAPELSLDLWYNLEAGWDFAYLTVSADGGQTWAVLPGLHSMPGQYGPAWNGRSVDLPEAREGWVSEIISLAPYAGQTIMVRLEVLSDFEGPSRGLAVADAHLRTADEKLPVNWQPNGFSETGWLLPQQWGVRVIREGGDAQVLALTPDATGMAEVELVLGPEGGAVIITPLTPPVAGTAGYWLSVEALEGGG